MFQTTKQFPYLNLSKTDGFIESMASEGSTFACSLVFTSSGECFIFAWIKGFRRVLIDMQQDQILCFMIKIWCNSISWRFMNYGQWGSYTHNHDIAFLRKFFWCGNPPSEIARCASCFDPISVVSAAWRQISTDQNWVKNWDGWRSINGGPSHGVN